MAAYFDPFSEDYVPPFRRLPAVLQLQPRNALEGALRYIPMLAWPPDTRRGTWVAFWTGDPEVLYSMAVLARRFMWINTIMCTHCRNHHYRYTRDIWYSIFRPLSTWVKETEVLWYACNLCEPCEIMSSNRDVSRDTHFWCGMCRDWIHRVYHYDCGHFIPSAVDYSDDSS